MTLTANACAVTLAPHPQEMYVYDHAGRLFAAWQDAWFISLGLSGRSIARRWNEGRRHIRALKPADVQALLQKGRVRVETALKATVPALAKPALLRSLAYDPTADIARHQTLYSPIGILPPDHYNACVVQITEGCGWNQCHFCTFYRRKPYHIKSLTDLTRHMEDIGQYFGEGLSLRRSIFLGDANAMAAPTELLMRVMVMAQEMLVPRMPQFRGFYSFIEPHGSRDKSAADFRALHRTGLKRLYFGLESGHPSLRQGLGKPGDLGDVTACIHQAKAAGLPIALILLAGAGGRPWANSHLRHSVTYIRQLPVTAQDIVFVSPLYGPDGLDGPRCSPTEVAAQVSYLRHALADRVRVATYDIREFVY